MKTENSEKVLNPVLNFCLFTVLFGGIGGLLAAISLFASPNNNGIGNALLSGICATPIAYGMFFGLGFAKKVKPYQRYILSAAILPVISGLLIGWTFWQQRPENIFKVFVADPIPVGVTNIQAHDDSIGIDSTIYVAFNATPKAIDQIIDFNHLEPTPDSEPDSQLQYFEGVEWHEKWKTYYFGNDDFDITMWVSPNGNTVLVSWWSF